MDLQTFGRGRISRKSPTLVVGKKPNGKSQLKRMQGLKDEENEYINHLKVYINNDNDIFAPLEPTLVSWLHVVREYTYRAPKDKDGNPDYFSFHDERPQVGFFAIAAWLNGWAVLQEWGTKKKNSSGRNDLWIGRGQTQFFIEAKQDWCRIDEGGNRIDEDIKKYFKAAKDSANNLIDELLGKKIAAAFIAPLWKQTDKPDFETARELWIQKISKAADAVALIAPCWDECPIDNKSNYCIGSALLLGKV